MRRRKVSITLCWMTCALLVAGCDEAAEVFTGDAAAIATMTPEELKAELGAQQKKVKQDPKNAEAQRRLGHLLHESKQFPASLAAYERALELDPEITDDVMHQNLLAHFGRKFQTRASNIIAQHKVIRFESDMRKNLDDGQRAVRFRSLYVLEQLGKATAADQVAVYTRDLQQEACGLRRAAVRKLGRFGGKGVLPALRAAAKKSKEEAGWFEDDCLEDDFKAAEKAILANGR